MVREPLVLGINAAYHETSAAIARGGRVLFAVEEERLTRKKHGKCALVSNPHELPWASIRACLDVAGARASELDAIGYSLVPGLRRETIALDPSGADPEQGFGTEEGERLFDERVRSVPALLARELGDESLARRFEFVPHHLAHAASAFLASPFETAAVLVVDGIGERATAWLGRASGTRLEMLEEVPYPHSLGLLWERFSVWLGFGEYDAAKVMGLAAYGDPAAHRSAMRSLLAVSDDGFRVDAMRARFRHLDVRGLEELFGPRRRPDEPPEASRFASVAAALQERTEEALLAIARRLARLTGERRVAYAGGVALNCVANARLEREGPFEELFVPSAAHDAGTALGVALLLSARRGSPRGPVLGAMLGPGLGAIEDAVRAAGLRAERVADPAREAARSLAAGRIVGWAQGAMELGPRALGHRSILADPRRRESRDELNRRIKHRESYRPFAASVLAESVGEWFELPARASRSRELMLLTYAARRSRAPEIPAVLHVDGTSRIQVVTRESDPLYHALLDAFRELTGVPLVLNTSLNDREPIACTASDALDTFRRSGLDELYLGDHRVRAS